MKKILYMLCLVLLLTGCQKPTEKLQITGIQTINYEKLIQNLNKNVTFMVYIGRLDCGDCQTFYPILQEYIDSHDGTGLYYINVKEWKEHANGDEASKEEKDFVDDIYKNLDFDWTPTLHVISNGKIKSRYQYLDEDYFKIEDRQKQKEKKQEFLDEFEVFMNNYFKEEKA